MFEFSGEFAKLFFLLVLDLCRMILEVEKSWEDFFVLEIKHVFVDFEEIFWAVGEA